MHHKSIAILFIGICMWATGIAQHFGIEYNFTPGFGFKQFTNDSMVFKNRQGDPKITFSMQSSLLGKFVFKNKHIGLLAGIGWRFDALTINRKGLEDFCILCNREEDTIAIKKIRIGVSSYTVPFGIEYAFDGKPKRRHHIAARLMIVPGKLFDANAYTKTDSARQVNYPMDLQKLETDYEQPISRFSLTMMPQLFFCLRIHESRASMNLSIMPIGIDLIHVNKTFIKPGMNAMFTMGFQYEFAKNTMAATRQLR